MIPLRPARDAAVSARLTASLMALAVRRPPTPRTGRLPMFVVAPDDVVRGPLQIDADVPRACGGCRGVAATPEDRSSGIRSSLGVVWEIMRRGGMEV